MQPGKKNESETADSLRLLEKKYGDRVFWYRLYDGQQVRKIINLLSKTSLNSEIRRQINQIAKYATYAKQPSDFLLIFDGKAYFLEDKSLKNPKRYSFRYVAEHQIKDLIEVNNAGSNGIFMFTNRSQKRNYKRYGVKAIDYKILRDEYLNEGVKSCTWDDFAEIGVEIPRIKGSKWDLTVLFNL